MNASNAKDYLPLVKALADGKVIQMLEGHGYWVDMAEISSEVEACLYRIKPKPREIWVNEWADGKRIFDSHDDASLHAMQYLLVRSTTRYREVIE